MSKDSIQQSETESNRGDCTDLSPSPCWWGEQYGSGTQVVTRSDPSKPHYHIGHLAADNEGNHGRSDVRRELESWLNGGDEPWWMDHVHRKDGDTVTLPTGCDIRATGPPVEKSDPPGGLWWVEDKRGEAVLQRGLLADAICKKQRPNF